MYMRFFCIVVFLLLNVYLFGQSSIRVHPFPTDAKRYTSANIEAVLISNNGEERDLEFGKKSVLKVRRLDASDYQLVYKNKFGHYTRNEFSLKKGDRNVDIYLKLDQLDSVMYQGNRRIDSLEMGDTLTINYHSMGCFHNKKEQISFYIQEGSIYATNSKDTILLNSEDLKRVRNFETELAYTRLGGCTTTEFYTVRFKGEFVDFVVDGSCDWYGYHRYLFGLFPRSEDE